MTNLKMMVDEYLKSNHISWRFKVIEFYKGLPTEEILKKACLAKTHIGKMDSHQRRVGKEKCKEGLRIMMTKESEVWKAKTFEGLKQVTDSIASVTHGLGPLWSYDTALRIGFKMNVFPDRVYVQSGVSDGIKNLLGKDFYKNLPRNRGHKYCLRENLPKELHGMEPALIENFLCIYKTQLIMYD
ncbi:hypothetical protein [Owenweeksia hongkongensis]|uniref:Uncharacterized protein n=1 Tax=Owenweeksia hongkongensis (strain DSM 17368 / CIP 108786 / JCM 12287 / NRRL B-23963 / UST20020801) TaxID=926562 RepID=G8QZT9_OWEHD|nr:hypothetical protein [Owenweeksia hongkongensis]AEV31533.1 hypothetical protein Oweho_0517 [Owenweeksia hongkongensis DSM 17368]